MAFDKLPRQFVESVRVIYDILDSHKRGYIEIKDIERRWNSENTEKLPSDVVACLRRVAPPNGRLTFEMFVGGLQESLTSARCPAEYQAPKPTNVIGLQHRSSSSPFIQVVPSMGSSDRLNRASSTQQISSAVAVGSTDRLNAAATGDAVDVDFYKRQAPRRRDSARRHTLGHGVDDSMLRRSKLLADERRVMLEGVEMAERLKNWYGRRLEELTERQRFGASGAAGADYSVEQQMERFNFERLRIGELNQQIEALTEPAGPKRAIMHMNLARPAAARQQTIPYEVKVTGGGPAGGAREMDAESGHAVQLIKAQNRLLNKEVAQKADKIAQLEKEKATLLRDLFESRANQRVQQKKLHSHPSNRMYEDSTFM